MKRIILSVTNDLTNDQRVEKVCNTLLQQNYTILLVGRLLKNSPPIQREYETKRFRLFFNKGILFYVEYNIRLFFFLLFSKKDIVLANDLDTLLPNYLISKLQKTPLVFDSHELFSEIPELVNKPFKKRVWKSLENYIIPKLKNTYTVCNSIAKHYDSLYHTNFRVLRNVPHQKRGIVKSDITSITKGKKIILYQGAVNIGRGIELMMETVKLLDDYILLIVGSGDIIKTLQEKTMIENLQNKVVFLGKITPNELQKITPNATVGLSLEEDLGLNYRYALPNKLFDYIQAEVPVITSNLPEMKQIVTKYNVGEILTERTPEKLSSLIEKVANTDYSKNLEKAKSELIWKNEEKVLIDIFKNLV
ncbi:hypothetical protein WH52_12390 [Tenacibaculum holothuriorum]|uniref:Glycosyl transferase family 1 domain-containing protein n=1 Tax=Tenacibaculum holothuriorum TaxID=1635173 RepID=A0A1Y2P9X7_9FLAO|nr:glycosyltransferase [Tenacibaculum holothuriorum]OSY87253.1 hypothetical protein WH52_12390 [Tenacibaculum holothuriorum]